MTDEQSEPKPPENGGDNYFVKYLNIKKSSLAVIGVVLLVVASFLAGANSAKQVDLWEAGIDLRNQAPGENLTTVDYGLLWKVLKVVSTEYVDKPVDQQELMYGSVRGLVEALGDPHSSFLTPEENKRFRDDLNGQFEGIGAEIGIRDGNLIVVAPLPGTPAERSGLRAQDLILKIVGEDSLDWSLEQAVTEIRGPKGTKLILTVIHKGESAPVEVPIIRDAIFVKSVELNVKTVNGQQAAVVKLTRFGPDTKQAFTDAVNQISKENITRVILDMRNNPGGLLDAAIDVTSFWLKNDKVALKELDAEKNESLYYAKGPGQLSGVKTIVLINEGSASASEIVTGALQDYKLATVVGAKSFGKGSVQDLIDLDDGSAVKITIAKWLTPNGRTINKQGLEPDVKVEMKSDDYVNQRDPQMDKALEVLKTL